MDEVGTVSLFQFINVEERTLSQSPTYIIPQSVFPRHQLPEDNREPPTAGDTVGTRHPHSPVTLLELWSQFSIRPSYETALKHDLPLEIFQQNCKLQTVLQG